MSIYFIVNLNEMDLPVRVAGYGIVNANKVKSNIIIIVTIYFGAFRIILVCRKRVINVSDTLERRWSSAALAAMVRLLEFVFFV